MSERFTKVHWSDSTPITIDKLARMNTNDEIIFEDILDGQYTAYNKVKPDSKHRLKMEVGTRTIGGGDEYLLRVNFAQKFSAGCNPVVIATLSTPNRHETMVTISGDGTKNPDRNRFLCRIAYQSGLSAAQRETFKYGTLHYMAVGY